MRPSLLMILIELGRVALILGASAGLSGALARGMGVGLPQGSVLVLAALVALPYAAAAQWALRVPARFRLRRRAPLAGAVLAVGAALVWPGLPWAALVVGPVALAVTLMVERLR